MNVLRKPLSSKARLARLLKYDQKCLESLCDEHGQAFTAIIGVDEVGRGSLVGPVIAAAVRFPEKLSPAERKLLEELDDSKATHLSHAKRVEIMSALQSCCHWGLGEASQAEVEELNVAQASLLASRRAVADLHACFPGDEGAVYPVILDGKLKIKDCEWVQHAVVKADSLSASVAAASVIAKATRDTMLMQLAQHHPGYGWETNAGYATPAHYEAMQRLGVTALHRRTYKAVQRALEGLSMDESLMVEEVVVTEEVIIDEDLDILEPV